MAFKGHIHDQTNEVFNAQRAVETITEYILTNLEKDLSIGTVSEKFTMSASTLKHLFKKYTGSSYHQYVERTRMEKAFELIIKGQRTQQTMYTTGYHYRSSFNKAFKKRFKHPPAYFRNKSNK
jgi:AraC-like DNA-binding protein